MSEFANAYEAAWDVLRFTLSEDGIRQWCDRPTFFLDDRTPNQAFPTVGAEPVREAALAIRRVLRPEAGLGQPVCPACGRSMRKNVMALLVGGPVAWVCDHCRKES